MKRVFVALAIVVGVGAFVFVRYRQATRADEPVIDRTSRAWQLRMDALSRARVFVSEAPRVAGQPLDTNPRDRRPFDPDSRVRCEYVPKRASGTTPKFDCRLPDGDVVKVKYGRTPEIHAEVAATRLLAALGFAADHVSLVGELECQGCPPAPYQTRQLAEVLFLSSLYDRVVPMQGQRLFHDVAVERKFEGRSIEVGAFEGWQWSELGALRPELGAATRADVDALRLMAVVLGHWDNKSANQRLVCVDPEREADGTPCAHSIVMLQDLGATFGPTKVNLDEWAGTPVWADSARCLVSMRELPYNGATFVDAEISEPGRLILANRLGALSTRQIEDLFEGAAFPDSSGDEPDHEGPVDVSAWIRALQNKIEQISDRPPCPDQGLSRGTSP